MNDRISSHKFFVTAIIIELLFLLFIAISSLGKTVNIELKADDFEIYDSKAEIRDYEAVDSLVKDENTLLVYDNKETQDIEKSIYISENDENTAYGRWIIGSDLLTLRPGMYEIEARYYSLWYSEYGGKSDESTGIVQLISEDNSSKIFYNDMILYDNVTINSQRLWVRSIKDVDDVQVKVCYYGLGELRIDSIVIRELPMWRIIKLLGYIIILSVIDVLYILLFIDSKLKNKEVIGLLIVIGLFSCIPFLTNFLFKGHDIKFHISRIAALADNLQAGKWNYPLQTEMYNGYGYIGPVFYGQLLLYVPAILYNLGAPMQVCYQIYMSLINIATLLITYFCIDGIVKDKHIAVFGSLIYMLSAYRVINMILREAVGEYSAMAFLPLIVYGFVQIYNKNAKDIDWKECLAIIVGLTGLIQTHTLSCEISAAFILLLCIIEIKKTFEFKRFIALACTAITALLLNLNFLIPFIQTAMNGNIKIFMMPVDKIQDSGTYLIQVLGVFMPDIGDDVTNGIQGEMPMALGFALVLGLMVFAWCCICKYKWKIDGDSMLRTGSICTGFAILSIVFSLRIFPWDSLDQISTKLAKIVCVIQYPWRYLSFAAIFALFATVISLAFVKIHVSKQAVMIVEIILASFTLLQVGHFYCGLSNSIPEFTVYGGSDIGLTAMGGEFKIGNDETDTAEEEMEWKTVIADLENISISDYVADHGTITFVCNNISDSEKFVQIPILNYENYHAYTEDETELIIENGENNRLGIWVPDGYSGTLRVQYEIPFLWRASNVVTAMTLFLIVVFSVWRIRRGKKEEEC